MAGVLSNVFSQNSDSNSDGTLVGDATAGVGLDASNESSSSTTNADGSSTESSDAQSLGADINTDSILGGTGSSMTDSDGGGSIL